MKKDSKKEAGVLVLLCFLAVAGVFHLDIAQSEVVNKPRRKRVARNEVYGTCSPGYQHDCLLKLIKEIQRNQQRSRLVFRGSDSAFSGYEYQVLNYNRRTFTLNLKRSFSDGISNAGEIDEI